MENPFLKTYLDVVRTDAQKVKELGARFDMARKQWFVPDGVDLQEFAPWLPKSITKWWAKL